MLQTKKYRAFMESYVQFMEEMAGGEKEKYSALVSYDSKRIDRVVSGQQAMNMRLAKMEEQRELEQREAGFDGLTFQQILERLSGEEREAFEALFRRFGIAVNEIKFFNGKSIAFAQDGLQMMGAVIESHTVTAPYKPDGKSQDGAQSTSLFEAKV